jgi:Zn-dependent protease
MGVRIGKIAGIEIRAHTSALLSFAGIALAFALFYLPQPDVTPDASLPLRLAVGALIALLLAGSVAFHEFAHAFVARARGKPVHVLTLYLFGGNAHVDDRGLDARDEIAIGSAGPLASGALATLFIGAGLGIIRSSKPAGELILDIGLANALLAVFNALPGFPMDGGRVLRGILWNRSGNAVSATKQASSAGRIIAYVIVGLGAWLMVATDVAAGVWVAATGWLLATLAQSYYRAMLLKIALNGLTVRDLCARDLPLLQTSDSVASASAYFGAGALSRTLPVLFGERAAGAISDVQVASVPADQAASTQVASVMTRAFELPGLHPLVEAAILPPVLATAPLAAAIVEEDGAYIGLVRKEDVDRYVEMVEELGNSDAARAGLKVLGPQRRLTAPTRDTTS